MTSLLYTDLEETVRILTNLMNRLPVEADEVRRNLDNLTYHMVDWSMDNDTPNKGPFPRLYVPTEIENDSAEDRF